MKLVGIGRGELGVERLVAYHILYGADQTALMTASFQHLLGNEGRGSLAVGSRDAYQLKPLQRMPHEVFAHGGERLSCGLHDELIVQSQIALADNRGGAVGGSGLSKVVPVALESPDTDKYNAIRNLPRIRGEVGDLAVAKMTCIADAVHYFLKPHCFTHSFAI